MIILKRKKIAIILGLVISLIGVNMQTTFGLEETSTEVTAEEKKEEVKKEAPVVETPTQAPVKTEPVVETPAQTPAPTEPVAQPTPNTTPTPTTTPNTTPNEQETSGNKAPDEGETPDGNEAPDEGEVPDGNEAPDEGETPDGSETPDGNETPDEGEIPDGNETPGEGEVPDGNETPDEGETPDGSETADKEEIVKPSATTPSTTTKPSTANKNSNTATTTTKKTTPSLSYNNSYTASDTFIDNRDKTKYNIEVPIEGLPSFITQEMIVGALKCQDETGYPASVTIAQIIQESGFGKYGPGGETGQGLSYLAYQYNNLFGIKGKGTAGSVNMRTGEQTSAGENYTITAGFRVYNTYTECIEDRTKLLEEVYSDLTFGVRDANTFAVKVGSRWATSISYGSSLITQMKTYDLYRLDKMTLGEFSKLMGVFTNPCPGATVSSKFGPRRAPLAGASTYHKGLDLGTGTSNLPTYAAEAGTVTYAGDCGSAGILVTIDHGNGLVTKYMHHDKIYVKVGQKVEKGQQIGLSGTTGNSTGNHLHFQVEKNGVAVDPEPLLMLED